MSLSSMTGFANVSGTAGDLTWIWEARSVNGRGLDLRLRLPDGFEELEAALRPALAAAFARGAIGVGLRLARDPTAATFRINPVALAAALAAAREAEAAAREAGLVPTQASVGELMALRGVVDAGNGLPDTDREGALAAMRDGIPALVAALAQARRSEGTALAKVLEARVSAIAALIRDARATAEARAARSGETLRMRVAALLDTTDVVDEARLAQELALIAVKADISEELDRLEAHVAAARALLECDGPVGRKFDFLTQEFNREANTICSKSGASDLTAVGLEMKVVIDQMREQVQNVE